jgi:hypothetical protein
MEPTQNYDPTSAVRAREPSSYTLLYGISIHDEHESDILMDIKKVGVSDLAALRKHVADGIFWDHRVMNTGFLDEINLKKSHYHKDLDKAKAVFEEYLKSVEEDLKKPLHELIVKKQMAEHQHNIRECRRVVKKSHEVMAHFENIVFLTMKSMDRLHRIRSTLRRRRIAKQLINTDMQKLRYETEKCKMYRELMGRILPAKIAGINERINSLKKLIQDFCPAGGASAPLRRSVGASAPLRRSVLTSEQDLSSIETNYCRGAGTPASNLYKMLSRFSINGAWPEINNGGVNSKLFNDAMKLVNQDRSYKMTIVFGDDCMSVKMIIDYFHPIPGKKCQHTHKWIITGAEPSLAVG